MVIIHHIKNKDQIFRLNIAKGTIQEVERDVKDIKLPNGWNLYTSTYRPVDEKETITQKELERYYKPVIKEY